MVARQGAGGAADELAGLVLLAVAAAVAVVLIAVLVGSRLRSPCTPQHAMSKRYQKTKAAATQTDHAAQQLNPTHDSPNHGGWLAETAEESMP